MPLIEELPITQSHRVTHGWAYVPDVGPTAIAAVQPGNRKRNRDATHAATATATAKQQKAIQSRLDSLDKENYKDNVSVPIPSRPGAEKKRDKKMTPNVRRILTYQRGFAHYLADEEANLAAGGGTNTVLPQQQGQARADAKKKATTTTTTTAPEPVVTSTPTPARRRGRPPASEKRKAQEKANEMQPPPQPLKQEDTNPDTEMTDAPSQPAPAAQPAQTQPSKPPPTKPPYDPALDADPLLRTMNLPKMPSARVMAALLAEPPLTYAAARAKMSDADEGSDKPVRWFCAVCGYWGKVKCRKCSEWTCGIMECWKGHEGVCVAQGF